MNVVNGATCTYLDGNASKRVAGEGLGSLASSGRGTWSSVVLAHTAILDREIFFLDMGKCVFASQTMRAVRFGCGPGACGARPALVVTHWSNTQRRAERSPERLESRWQLDYGGFRERCANREGQKCRR